MKIIYIDKHLIVQQAIIKDKFIIDEPILIIGLMPNTEDEVNKIIIDDYRDQLEPLEKIITASSVLPDTEIILKNLRGQRAIIEQ